VKAEQLDGGCLLYLLPGAKPPANLPPAVREGQAAKPAKRGRKRKAKSAVEHNPAHELMPFGKYRGVCLSIVTTDANYAGWLMAQPWFEQQYPGIFRYFAEQATHDTGDNDAA